MANYFVHATAEVSQSAKIGAETKIWHYAQVREGAVLGKGCVLGKNVYVDRGVSIGNNCRIQNSASIYHGTVIGDNVFIGPGTIFTNHKIPRAINKQLLPITAADWNVGKIEIGEGVSFGAGCIIIPNVIIGQYAIIGAGSLVTKDIPQFSLAYGNPARVVGAVCICTHRFELKAGSYKCPECEREYKIDNNNIIIPL